MTRVTEAWLLGLALSTSALAQAPNTQAPPSTVWASASSSSGSSASGFVNTFWSSRLASGSTSEPSNAGSEGSSSSSWGFGSWRMNSSNSFSDSGSGSYTIGENDVGGGVWEEDGFWGWNPAYPPHYVEVELDEAGKRALEPWERHFFNSYYQELDTAAANSTDYPPTGGCPHRFCVYLTFSSEYGALTDFDAFVLDRYETKSSWELKIEQFPVGGDKMPLVLGQLSNAERDGLMQWNANGSHKFEWNDSRRSVWTLYPADDNATELDVVLSFKQLYTLLPDYNGTNITGEGPFYSDNLNDQVIIRLTASLDSSFSGTTAMLPMVFASPGSQLFSVDYESTLLFGNDSQASISNEMLVDFSFQRRRYGGFQPWAPAELGDYAKQCSDLIVSTGSFADCITSEVNEDLFQHMLTPGSNLTSFAFEDVAFECLELLWTMLLDGNSSSFPSSWSASDSSASDFSSSSSSPSVSIGDEENYDPLTARIQAIRAADEALRCYSSSGCPVGDSSNWKTDGRMIAVTQEPAKAQLVFYEQEFSFFLNLTLRIGTEKLMFTTPALTSYDSEEEMRDAVISALPYNDSIALDLVVNIYNNTEEIAATTYYNNWLMDQLNGSSSSSSSSSFVSSSSSSSFGSTVGDWSELSDSASDSSSSGSAGTPNWQSSGSNGPAGGPPPNGGSNSGPDLHGTLQNRRRLAIASQLPPLMAVPEPQFTVEFVFKNISVTPIEVKTISTLMNTSTTLDPTLLTFRTKPLDLQWFSYVPPPTNAWLTWEDETPAQNFYLPGSCSECAESFMACVYDEDCRFGVRTYLFAALQRQNFPSPDQLRNSFGSSSWYNVDITQTIRDSSLFFPGTGYDTMGKFLTCLGSRLPSCNLQTDGDDTNLQFTPSRIEIRLNSNASFGIYYDGYWFSYQQNSSSTAQDLKTFLLENVLQNTSWDSIQVSQNQTSDNRVAYEITLPGLLRDLQLWSQQFQTEIYSEPWRMVIDSDARDNSTLDIAWPLLLDWLNTIAWYNSSNAPSFQATPSGVICTTCVDKLSACLADTDCVMSVMNAVAPALNSSLMRTDGEDPPTVLSPDNLYRTNWSSEMTDWEKRISSSSYAKVFDLFSCLSENSCPVGYSSGSNIHAPTTVKLSTRFSASVEPASTFIFTHNGEEFEWNEDGDAGNFATFLSSQVFAGESLLFSTSRYSEWDGRQHYEVVFQRPPVHFPLVTSTDAGARIVQGFVQAGFESGLPLPSWTNLLGWFGYYGGSNANGSDWSKSNGTTGWTDFNGTNATTEWSGVYVPCASELSQCFNNTPCAQVLHNVVAPELSPPTNNSRVPVTVSFQDWGLGIYKANLSQIVRDAIDSDPTQSGMPGLKQVIQCFTDSAYDLEYMTEAVMPPATAHIPTVMRFSPANGSVLMYLDTQITLIVNSQQFMFTASNDVNAFTNWLSELLAVQGITTQFTTINGTFDSERGVQYEFTCDWYLGAIPELFISAFGQWSAVGSMPHASIGSWSLWMESYSHPPSWNRLIDLLSVSPLANTSNTTESSAFQCDSCNDLLKNCYGDFMCMSTLQNLVLPSAQSNLGGSWNSSSNEFFWDASDWFNWQVYAYTGPFASTRQALVDILACSASELCITRSSELASPQAMTDLIVQEASLSALVPIGQPITISYMGNTYEYEVPGNDPLALQIFLQNDVVNYWGSVNANITSMAVAGDFVSYDITFHDLFRYAPPHISSGPATNPVESTDRGWKLQFESTDVMPNRPFGPWLQWLSTNPTS